MGKLFSLVFFVLLQLSCATTMELQGLSLVDAPQQPRVELLKGQRVSAIKDLSPEFSWQLPNHPEFYKQTAYQIQILPANIHFSAMLPSDKLWDSGKILDEKSLARSISGYEFGVGQSYQWRVRVWTQDSQQNLYQSAWSTPQLFSISSTPSKLASRYDVESTAVKPVIITKLPSGRYFIDFGKVAFGYLQLELTTDKAGEIDVHFAERGVADGAEQGIISKLHKGSSVRYYKVPLNVSQNSDVYAVHPPKDQRNTKPEVAIAIPGRFGRVAPFRFVEIDGKDIEISNIQASLVKLHYPFDDNQSDFVSSNSTLDAIWQLCKYTMKATSFAGVYVDGDRERIPYEADAYINQLSHYYVDDEFSLARHSHEYLMQNPTWPTEWKQHSVMMAWTDWMYTGDTESLAQFYHQLKAEKTLEQFEGDLGLLSTYPKRNREKEMGDIVDWPPSERDNYDLVPINTVVNAFYYLNLKQMADIAGVLGLEQEQAYYQHKAQSVYQAFNQHFFNEATGLYIDGIGSKHSAVHANILPLAVGLVPKDKVPKIINFIKQKGMAVSVYFAQYLMEALYMHKQADYALSLLTSTEIRSWYNMIRQGSTITMEAWDDQFKPNQDWNHAWGAVPGNIIGRYLLGVQPLVAGFTSFKIAPQPSNLTYVAGTVPSIRGPIRVEIEQKLGAEFTLVVSVPGNARAQIILPIALDKKIEQVWVNGKKAEFTHANGGVELEKIGAGRHTVKVLYQ
ncbi:alpha-L-rhamnosidase C-terminal domain-containing protein [Catenovulum agarivorans]|uniref:alpha-L-rhamnosidase-related protein n=1 Tax=Catenovulum agarivorans TaxID=1172192 RepID=UPI00037DC01A|nr:alpha-L-rhamnosidase C-terminal domain-containing protein [Catenovulum agarivorans]